MAMMVMLHTIYIGQCYMQYEGYDDNGRIVKKCTSCCARCSMKAMKAMKRRL